MKRIIILYFLVSIVGCKSNKEKRDTELFQKIEEIILNEKTPNQEYLFKINSLNEKGVLEYYFTYLGSVNVRSKGEIKFIQTKILSGLYEDSKRANTIISLYKENIKVGSYYIGGSFDTTPILKDGILHFKSNSSLDCNLSTEINFNDSIPSNIFIKCRQDEKNTFGDLYEFNLKK